jgi:hypothetical protein
MEVMIAAPGPQAGPGRDSESEGQAANGRTAPGGRAVRSNFNFGVQAGLPLAVAAAAAQAWGKPDPSGQGQSALGDLAAPRSQGATVHRTPTSRLGVLDGRPRARRRPRGCPH